MKILLRVIAVLLLVLLLLGSVLFFYLYNLKPKHSGSLALQGLRAPVEVFFDAYGIPHIYAQSEADAYFALGYVHAQERLFQMEIMRRLVNGRLSELLGKDLVETDRFFRTLRIARLAEQSANTFLKDTTAPYQKAAHAYLAGVNQFVDKGPTPVEFTLLGIPKEKFTPKDIYGTIGYMAFSFAQAFRTDPLLTRVYHKLGPKHFNEMAAYGSVNPPAEAVKIPSRSDSLMSSNMHRLSYLVNDIVTNYMPVPLLQGSNGWLISGNRSKSGKPLLCNDTHIAYAQPAVWYEAHLEYPGNSFYGNFLAGMPFAAVGHSRNGGWGLTMFENDDIDFYSEKTNPDNPNQYWVNDHWENMQVYQESIKVNDGEDVVFNVRLSRHGVIINDVLEDVNRSSKQAVSLWWSLHHVDNTTLQGAYELAQSKNVKQAQQAASLIAAPGLNVMFADKEGNIAWWAAAKLVKRPAHVNSMLILDGASGKDEPLGFYPFASNPSLINPASGFIYSANNQPGRVEGSYYPGYYLADDRARSIVSYLNSNKSDWTVADLQKMITDGKSSTASHIIHNILAQVPQRDLSLEHQRAIELLKEWDGSHGPDDIAPTIYYKLLYRVVDETFSDELVKKDMEILQHTYFLHAMLPRLIQNDSSVWWDVVHTKSIKETRQHILSKAFEETVKDLVAQLGPDMSAWQWQKVHTLEHVHPLGRKKPLDKIFNIGPFAVPGGQEVINNLSFVLNAEGRYQVSSGPAMRIIIDFADVDNSLSVLPTGQSGYFLSEHYDDQAPLFNAGEFRKQMMDRQEIEKTAKSHLMLVRE